MPRSCQSCRCFCCREHGVSYSDDIEYHREYEVPRNFISAAFGVITFVFLSTSLADEHWFVFHNGACNVKAIGLVPFFFDGRFVLISVEDSNKLSTKYMYSTDHRSALINCVDSDVVKLLRTVMVLLGVASIATSLQVFFDLLGNRRSFFKTLQMYAIGSTITVFLCFANLWLSFAAVMLMTKLQRRCLGITDYMNVAADPGVTFSVGFYLNVAAIASSLLAVCFSCFTFGGNLNNTLCFCFGRRRFRVGPRRASQPSQNTASCGWRCRRSPPRDVSDLQSLLMDDDVPLLIPIDAPPAYTP